MMTRPISASPVLAARPDATTSRRAKDCALDQEAACLPAGDNAQDTGGETSNPRPQWRAVNTAQPVAWQARKRLAASAAISMATVAGIITIAKLRAFWCCGSKPLQAHWISDLPPAQRKTAQALNALVQEAPADMIANQPPSIANAILAAAQLLPHAHATTRPGAQITSPITPRAEKSNRNLLSAANRQATTPLMAAMMASARDRFISAHGAPQTDPANGLRNRRTIVADDITPPQIRTRLFEMMESYKKWPAFWGELHALYIEAKNAPEISDRNDPDNKNVRLLLKCMTSTIAVLNEQAARDDLSQSYHLFSSVLHDLWSMAKRINAPRSQALISSYRDDLRRKKWQRIKDEQHIDEDAAEQTLINRYLQSAHPLWHARGIKSSQRIVIHARQEAHSFSLADLLHGRHLALAADPQLPPHFQSDNSGIAETELRHLMSASSRQQFRRFKEAPENLPPGHYAAKAMNLLEQYLKNQPYTPLYFQRQQAIQEIIDNHAAALSTEQSGSDAQQETILALGALALQTPVRDMLEEVALAYAEVLLARLAYRHPLLGMDFIYHYTDEQKLRRYDTATLTEILNKDTGAAHIAVAQRADVTLHWPREFDDALLCDLTRCMQSANQFSDKLRRTRLLAEIQNALSEGMPDFSSRLENSLTELCQLAGVHDCSLSDQFVFTYQVRAVNMNHQGAGQILHPMQIKSFTASDILLGKQRQWRAHHHVYNQELIVSGPSHLAMRKLSTYVIALQNFKTQAVFTLMLDKLKHNDHLKALHEAYVNLLVAPVSAAATPAFRFRETPLLLVYPRRKPNAIDRAWAARQANADYLEMDGWHIRRLPDFALIKICAIGINVVSLLSGKIYTFASLRHMTQQLAMDAALAQEFKAHFPVDYGDDFSALAMTDIVIDAHLYEQIIDWHIENIDKMVRSHAETAVLTLSRLISDCAFIFTLPSMLLSPAAGFALAALLSVGPKLMQAAASDTRQEQEALLVDAVLALTLEIGAGLTQKLILKTVKSGVRKIFSKPEQSIRLPQQSVALKTNGFRTLGKNIDIFCPGRGKRAPERGMCTLTRAPLSSRAGAARAFDHSLSWIQHAARAVVNLPSIRKLFGAKISKVIINDIKPIAMEKLQNAMDIIADAAYGEQLALSAQAYFGKAFKVAPFIKKMQQIEKAIEKLTPENISILAQHSGQSSFVAEDNINHYRAGGKDLKYLRIDKNNFHAYYQHMDNSNNAIADLLIHELSHVSLNSMDFIYVGSRQYKHAQVNVFELINLGNKNLHANVRNYVSDLGGTDLAGLRGSSIDFAGTAGLNNADSVTQFISFLSKAKTNHGQFMKEYEVLRQASMRSNQFDKRIDHEILLSRAKRQYRHDDPAPDPSRQIHLAQAWQSSPEKFSNYVLVMNENEFSLYTGSVPPPALVNTP